MRIEKVINNNVISALDDQGREIVAMGRGIGFQKKSGQEIKAAQVEKIFHLGSPDLQARFQELLANMPMECVQVSDEIISYAKSHLSMQLNQNVYLALTDDIDFALSLRTVCCLKMRFTVKSADFIRKNFRLAVMPLI